MKACGACQLFRPSPFNPKVGNGGCKAMESWEAKHKERGTKPTDTAFKAVDKEMGVAFGTPQALWHPRSERKNCKRFEALPSLTVTP